MSPAAENVQQARRLIADLAIPAEPCRADAHPKRAPESPLNNDQQAAVNRSRAVKACLTAGHPKSAVSDFVQTSAKAAGFCAVPKSATICCCW